LEFSQMTTTKKVPLGKPLKFTPEQLDELAKVTPTDILKAQEAWRNAAPKKFKTLLDAQTVDESGKPNEQ
jgi:hypothetical protein